MTYSSTLVTYGTGLGLVTETGDATEIGKISTLITTTKTLDTALTKRIVHFSHRRFSNGKTSRGYSKQGLMNKFNPLINVGLYHWDPTIHLSFHCPACCKY